MARRISTPTVLRSRGIDTRSDRQPRPIIRNKFAYDKQHILLAANYNLAITANGKFYFFDASRDDPEYRIFPSSLEVSLSTLCMYIMHGKKPGYMS